jgi:uncharacterized protein (DUF1778 family)
METDLDLKRRLDRRLKSGTLRTRTIGARVTETEEEELIAAAKRSGQNVSEWTRNILLNAAQTAKEDAIFTELIATRLLLVNLLKPMLLGEPVPENWITDATNGVRGVKHKAAAELRREYASRTRKEVNNEHTLG